MDLSKIKTLIDFVGRSNITELTVTEKDVTVRIFRTSPGEAAASEPSKEPTTNLAPDAPSSVEKTSYPVKAPLFGVLHRAPAPGEPPFVAIGDVVEEGQTLFIIEAMKVFNTITAPRSGRITQLTDIDNGEVETGDLLAEIA
ncbi:acetyl-CoA carboxylase biotin carboxyl carrier protein subunit [Rhizobium sp. CCGE 510]|uniref:acetyl-CoA carboxylase biotin carboxyl carrier protein n=1 Tax=Rhizobium sp. CCGE 510 TaxID=1132836 RepID=UPI00027B8CCA|nr:acetyl-CoA carboxylase biotin carboxyl carrier protein subunit [Rhizobium sp. CCGE 510]EJT01770.1 biotin/lipoyl attachment domain-containing protein [Rhizobium sp. CCGE 510]